MRFHRTVVEGQANPYDGYHGRKRAGNVVRGLNFSTLTVGLSMMICFLI